MYQHRNRSRMLETIDRNTVKNLKNHPRTQSNTPQRTMYPRRCLAGTTRVAGQIATVHLPTMLVHWIPMQLLQVRSAAMRPLHLWQPKLQLGRDMSLLRAWPGIV